jgi:hypothetical protein
LKLLKCESYLINGTELKDWGRPIAVSGHGHFGPGQARAALTDGGAAVPAGVGVGRNRSYFNLKKNSISFLFSRYVKTLFEIESKF